MQYSYTCCSGQGVSVQFIKLHQAITQHAYIHCVGEDAATAANFFESYHHITTSDLHPSCVLTPAYVVSYTCLHKPSLQPLVLRLIT